ncbi:hypothetical protein C4569_03100 [Candidatus Parcubacteria bacterium]|nr:MAG: hypothetical protein C4569_03100 [Candidatus Parcubacteria bacterium]
MKINWKNPAEQGLAIAATWKGQPVIARDKEGVYYIRLSERMGSVSCDGKDNTIKLLQKFIAQRRGEWRDELIEAAANIKLLLKANENGFSDKQILKKLSQLKKLLNDCFKPSRSLKNARIQAISLFEKNNVIASAINRFKVARQLEILQVEIQHGLQLLDERSDMYEAYLLSLQNEFEVNACSPEPF